MNEFPEDHTKHLKGLIRHIDAVRANCLKLGDLLIEGGDKSLGLKLITNGYRHDNSKFSGIEWLYLNDETKEKYPDLFRAAHYQHITTNLHHPEAWHGGIHSMDRLHLAEMVCDWSARSAEFGTDLRVFLRDKATKKYDMAIQSKKYRQIKELVDMLLDPPFK